MAKPKKVKRAKPKVSKDNININIKNIMSQIQNQPKRDYIKPQKRIPKDSFNTGESYRAFAPAITYASNPLQAFQGIAPIANPPAIRQLTSMPAIYRSEPIPAEANAYDIEPVRQPAPFVAPRPVVPQRYKQSTLENWGLLGPKQSPSQPASQQQPVSAPIYQSNTRPLDEPASMTTREQLRAEGKRMESPQQKQERLIAEGKIIKTSEGKFMFPRTPGQ